MTSEQPDIACPVLRRMIGFLEEQNAAETRVSHSALVTELRHLEDVAAPLGATAGTVALIRSTREALLAVEAAGTAKPAQQDAVVQPPARPKRKVRRPPAARKPKKPAREPARKQG